MAAKVLWVVGELFASDSLNAKSGWGMVGVFDSEEKALEAATEASHFLGPVLLNQRFPDEVIEWDGAYFPGARAAKEKMPDVRTETESDARTTFDDARRSVSDGHPSAIACKQGANILLCGEA